jgi:hypothetical protein
MPENLNKPRILVSCSPQPDPNDEFVRGLAERLRRVGFEIWADQGNTPRDSTENAASRQEPLLTPRHALFIVTENWLARLDSRAEIDLLERKVAETHRRIVVRRDRVDDQRLGPVLSGLPSVEWLPSEPEPDARFWEIYCGLTRTPLGDRGEWVENGRNLLAGWQPSLIHADAKPGADTTDRLDCGSRPILARHAGNWTLLQTDSAACFRVEHRYPLAIHPLPDLDGCSSVAVTAEGMLVAGLYDGMVASLVEGEWAYRSAEAPVLSLAAAPQGLVIGDARGVVSLRGSRGAAIASATLGEPVVDLAALDAGVVALGARGGLWQLSWSEGGAISTAPIQPSEALDRPVGLFATGNSSRLGVYSTERLGLLGGDRFRVIGVRRFPEGINAIVPFGLTTGASEDPPLGLLTDGGNMWAVGPDLKTVAPVTLPSGENFVVGVAPGVHGGLLAWTAAGTLFAIDRDYQARTVASGDVALAYVDPDLRERVAIVYWRPERAIQIRRQSLEPAR